MLPPPGGVAWLRCRGVARQSFLTAAAAVLSALAFALLLVAPGIEVAGVDVEAVAAGAAAVLLVAALVLGREERARAGLPAIEGLAVVSLDAAGRVDAWNPAASRLFGLDRTAARGTDAGALFAPEELSGLRAELASVSESGRAVPPRGRRFRSAAGETFEGVGLLARGRGGEVLLVALDARAPGPDGRCVDLLENAPAGLLHVGRDGRIGSVSPELARWAGRRRELLPGLPVAEAGLLPRGLAERLGALATGEGPEPPAEEEAVELPGPSGATRPVVAVARRRAGGGADVALLPAPGRRRLVAELDAAKKAVTAAREAAAETIERTARDRRGPVAEAVATAGRPRVLLVEDDDENRSLISHMLRSRGADVVAFPTGGEAIEAASRSRFDLGLLDLGIPDMDGYEVFRRLRALPGGEDLPLVAVTAFTSDFDKERAQLEGFNDFVPKPVTLSAVDALLRRFVPRSRG